MDQPKEIIALINNSDIRDKLNVTYSELAANKSLPFEVKVRMMPEIDEIDRITRNNACLFFFEACSGHPQPEKLDIVRHLCQERGHQIILLADTNYDYLKLAEDMGIGNILIRDQFDHDIINAISRRLLGSAFFGLAPFFPEQFPVFDKRYHLTGPVSIDGLAVRTFGDFGNSLDDECRRFFYSSTTELLINAIFYGVCGITEDQRDRRLIQTPRKVDIPEELAIDIHIVQDHEKYGFSISDKRGTLRPARILKKIRRHTAIGNELPPGIGDQSGRGLFMLTRQTRIVFNVLRGERTEVILMFFFSEDKNQYQSLIINERYPGTSVFA